MQKHLTFKNIDYKLKQQYFGYTGLNEIYKIKVNFTCIFFTFI